MAARKSKSFSNYLKRLDAYLEAKEVSLFRGKVVHRSTKTLPKKFEIIPKPHGTKQSAASWITGVGGGAEYFAILDATDDEKGYLVVDIDPGRHT